MTPRRVPLACLPTPLVPAPRLAEILGSGPLWIKRDDLTGFAVAGNKARALEYLLGDALDRGCDVLVAAGSVSSNFCAAAAVAARRCGLDCELLLAESASVAGTTNLAMARAVGARLHFDAAPTRENLDDVLWDRVDALRAAGRRPYPLPRGGATPIGAIGYAYAVQEVAQQCEAMGIQLDTVVVATGSGATQAGLVAGQVGYGLPWHVIGASVSRPIAESTEQVRALAKACAAELGFQDPSPDAVDVRDLRGAGFGIASPADRMSTE
ncbi:MAG TPA: pyridoxal-phosphate dependent enzyme, partial [Gaiellales bacterium]|nr:pyridoxal-phosphate dependent enzyme [Gaiellales bacterium]